MTDGFTGLLEGYGQGHRLQQLLTLKPPLYTPSEQPFWDDEHISAQMLKAHLDPGLEAASRKHAFMDSSAAWIKEIAAKAGHGQGSALLDLGCGPGLYCERLHDLGFRVTGVDLSARSIAYAKVQAEKTGRAIAYRRMDYLALDAKAEFDVAILIYCDFGVLSPAQRAELLERIYAALRPGGVLILDGYTPRFYTDFHCTRSIEHSPDGGFWAKEPYLCIKTSYRYDETLNFLEQYILLKEGDCVCYNIWEQAFEPDALEQEFARAGFGAFQLFGDAAGAPYSPQSPMLCTLVQKRT